MANTIKSQVAVVDTQNAVIIVADVKISGIQIVPSNTTWSCEITDGSNNTVISLTQDSPTPVITPKMFSGLKAGAFTNITKVLLWIN